MKALQVIRHGHAFSDRGRSFGQLQYTIEFLIENQDQIAHISRSIVTNGGRVFISPDELPATNKNRLDLVIESVSEIHSLKAASAYKTLSITVYVTERIAARLKQEIMRQASISIPVSDELADSAKAHSGASAPPLEVDMTTPSSAERKGNTAILETKLHDHIRMLDRARTEISEQKRQIGMLTKLNEDLASLSAKLQGEAHDLHRQIEDIVWLTDSLMKVLEEKELREHHVYGKDRFQLLEID